MIENPAQPVVVRERLTSPHPLVVATQTAAVGAKPDATGRLELGRMGGSARLTVSRAALPRALHVLDAFCKGAEARGWTVSVGKKYTGQAVTHVAVEGRTVRFAMTEDCDKQPHVLTKYEQVNVAKGYPYGIPTWDRTPNGRLGLRLVDCYDAKRSRWNDGVRQRLDDMLTDALDEVGRAFEAEHQRDLERERKEEEHRRKQVEALERGYQRLIESRRASAVIGQARTWRQSEDLRAYMGEVRVRAEKLGDTTPDVQAWLDYVQIHLDEVLDPPGHMPTLPSAPRRDDPDVAEHLVLGAGRWSEAWLEWSRG